MAARRTHTVVPIQALRDRAAADPIGAYEQAGLPAGALRRAGRNLQALCPLHGDTNPSFTVFPDGRFKCFGCGAMGSILDFYMAVRKVTHLPTAVEQLAGLLGFAPGVGLPPVLPTRPAAPPPPPPAPIPESVVEECHRRLMDDPRRLAWLQHHKGLPLAIIEDARLGLGTGPAYRGGIRYTIPIMAEDDHATYVDLRGYRPRGKPKMLPWSAGRGTHLFPWPVVCREQNLCWVEGELDCLNLIGRGRPAVTATNGVQGALTVKLPDLSGKRFVVVGDDDDAGRELNEKLPPRLIAAGATSAPVLSWEEVFSDAGTAA
jgi:hypothetical protein